LQLDATAIVRDLRDGWTGRCLALVAVYVAAGYVASSATGLQFNWLSYYMLSQARTVLISAYSVLVVAWLVNELVGPRARLGLLGPRIFSFRFLAELVLATVAVHVTLTVFVNLKLWIPVINERLYDSPFWRWDRILHFGVDPAVFASELAARWKLLGVIDRAYMLFFPAQLVVPLLFMMSARLRPQRGRFFFAYCLMWMVGSLVYVLWPSLGPIYYAEARFPWIDQAPYAYTLQGILIEDYAKFRAVPSTHHVKLYYGVAALPSLHVAMFALFAIATRPWRPVAAVLWLLTAITFVGSLALAWHYAIDGYAGALLALAVWWIAGRCVAPQSEPAASASPAAIARA
jgi:hypothetical protein